MIYQGLNVPSPTDLEECLCFPPISCFESPSQIQQSISPQRSITNCFPSPGDPLLDLKNSQWLGLGHCHATSGPGALTKDPSPIQASGSDRLPLQRLHFEPWMKIASCLLLQQHKPSSLSQEQVDISPEQKPLLSISSLTCQKKNKKKLSSSCHNVIDTREAPQPLSK